MNDKNILSFRKTRIDKSWRYFEVISLEPITEAEGLLLQENEGRCFAFAGYGFYGFTGSTLNKDTGHYVTRWKCSASCD